MLSKKMAVSLTSLITILVLASMPASAFDVKFDAHDISFADGVQIERTASLVAYINFGEVVTLEAVRVAFGLNADGTGGIATTINKPGHVDILNYHGAVIDVGGNAFTITRREVDDRLTAAANRIQAGKDYTITVTLPTDQLPGTDPFNMNTDAHKLRLHLDAKGVADADPNSDKTNNKGNLTIDLVNDEPTTPADRLPMPVSIALAPGTLIPAAGFTGDTFNIIVTLSEQPKENKLIAADRFAVDKGTAADAVYLGPAGIPVEDTDTDGYVSTVAATGRSGMHQQYLVTITPNAEDADLVFKLLAFGDQERYKYVAAGDAIDVDGDPVGPNMWKPKPSELDRMEGVDKITVKIKKKQDIALTGGLEVVIPKEKRIPASGYIVFTKNAAGSGILKPAGSDKDEPKAHERNPAQMLYNVVDLGIPNLETFLANGGTIDLIGSGLYISEIMWGSDASLKPNNNSQWIEIANKGTSSILTGDKTHKLIFYGPNETPPAVSTVADRVGTVGAGGYWSIAGMGQSGRSGTDEQPLEGAAVVPTQALISMQRLMGADGTPADGTMASSWAASTPPGLNFDAAKVGTRVGSPGAAPVAYPVAPTPEPEPAPAPVVPVAGAMDIMITEIMVDTGNGRLPQWIELTNVSGAEKSLAGWSLMITNAAADANVIGATVNINLSGTLGVGGGMDAGGTMGKSLLLVGGSARSSSNLAGSDRVVDISSQVNQRGRYAFISAMGFMAALIPPQKTGVLAYGDTAGNLGADAAWELPMDDSGRSSLIRREMLADGMATMGTDANGWVLASDTPLVSGPATWYGSDEDAGTPGYDAGGPLPVELSHFRPARDKQTGAVVITWATQSELNNAGFFIKRSNQRDGEFQVINATMVPGAGTTSEKQTYTYTDTTAQPNIVYYYQIEDVSLDGNRQTLTRGIRLKGHIGAAGKLTSTWGELKSSNE